MFYRNYAAWAVLSLFACTSHSMEEERNHSLQSLSKSTKHPALQLFLDTSIGSFAGAAEVIGGGQLQFALKNKIQQGQKLSWHSFLPQEWLPGISINMLAMVPTTAVQVSANGLLNCLYPAELVKDKLQHAFCSGALSGLVSGPAEQTIIYQLIHKCNLKSALKELWRYNGLKALFRLDATLLAMGRDGIFAPGFLILPDLYSQYFNIPTSMSKLLAGVTVAIVTHPLDRIKGALQGDIKKEKYKNAFDATAKLWKKGGIKELYAGGLWRGTRVCSAIALISTICKQCDEYTK